MTKWEGFCFHSLEVRLHAQATTVSSLIFSLMMLCLPGRSLMTASWLLILLSKARSSLAPRASFFMKSVFSSDRTTRCEDNALFSMRSRPVAISRISAWAELFVWKVGVVDGAAEMVE